MTRRDQSDDQLRARHDQVWARLATVMDPELDESVTELNFVTHANVDAGNRVHIGFRLPTYWCAANFSFLMADDMRRVVADIDWVEGVEVTLGEHMYADKINAGLAQGLSFRETFGEEADGDVEEVRRTFLLKAFQRRQYAILNHLVATNYSSETLVAMTIAELEALDLDAEGNKLRQRYFDRLEVLGPVRPHAAAFLTSAAETLSSESLPKYLSGLRRVGVNAEFNGALCRGLLAVRFDLETPLRSRSASTAASVDAQLRPSRVHVESSESLHG
jgi:metal-sulfur cluster biosynthetic enzyme